MTLRWWEEETVGPSELIEEFVNEHPECEFSEGDIRVPKSDSNAWGDFKTTHQIYHQFGRDIGRCITCQEIHYSSIYHIN